MQSGNGTQQGLGGGAASHGRNMVGPSSSSASPSSSSSQSQQQQPKQSLQPQLLGKPDGKEATLAAYQAGVLGVGNFASSSGVMQLPQPSRKFIDVAQQRNVAHIPEEGHNRSEGIEQQVLNPVQQAYIHYTFQAAQQRSASGIQSQQQAKIGMVGPQFRKDQNTRMGNLKMQELMNTQATNQAQTSLSNNPPEHFAHDEQQTEQVPQAVSDQRSDPKPPIQSTSMGQFMQANVARPIQAPQAQQNIQNTGNRQLTMALQIQTMQALAREHNIDLSLPANANMMAQLFPLMQSRMLAQQQTSENGMGAQSSNVPMPMQQVALPKVARDSPPHLYSSSNVSGQSGSTKAMQAIAPSPFGTTANAMTADNDNSSLQQFSASGRENQVPPRQTTMIGNGRPPMHPPQSSVNLNQGVDCLSHAKSTLSGAETLKPQYANQSNRSPQSAASPIDGCLGNLFPSQGGVLSQMQHPTGFTKQQLHVLKAQILAFRRLKKGDGTLPQELLQAIVPPPLETQRQPVFIPVGTSNQNISAGKNADDHARELVCSEKDPLVVAPSRVMKNSKEEALSGEDKVTAFTVYSQGMPGVTKQPALVLPSEKEEQQTAIFLNKPEEKAERSSQETLIRSDFSVHKGKSVAPQFAVSESMQAMKPLQAINEPQPKDVSSTRKYHGPLFDSPFFTRKQESLRSALSVNNNNLVLAYDVKDLLVEEGVEVLTKKRTENLRKIGGLLAVNLERKRIRPDLVLRLQIEERKLRLLDLQVRLRGEVDQQQQEIMAMPDRPYRKFVRLCERQRMELTRQVQASQKAMREKQLKSLFQWRKKLLEAHWAIRDARTARNRGVAKYHERMVREFSKSKDDDRNKRMEALKNNDVERYREMLLEQQTNISGDASERYAVLSSFLSQTEEYLHKLGSKITAAKNQQEVEEAANIATSAARAQGLSEEEVRAAATCAGEEVMIRNRFSEMNAPKDSSSVNKYYHLAHAVNERVIRQPSMLRAGTLRDYQLVGLQWMLSLYNNKLNGILADEMGLGKTVQVMALIAYLMEFKGNYGPHIIIVPNAVLVNWKSELHTWLPSVSCIFYVGGKDQRSKLFSQVLAMKFNVLVTTYEFVMFDRSKLSKVDWKYIIIDEAQRMKDRESVLARDLDKYRCQRRLLLTGTPLQNDLKELWSLLNLLLPEVFDNRKAFHDWFSKPFQKEVPSHNAEDDWLETEKKVIIIHRLHQILEPFMLRRRVEDVEGSLPPKISIVLRCRMSAIQSSIYDWIKSTGTIRVDPEDEQLRVQKNPNYQAKVYKPVTNRCMELRKTCNHPLLSYPYFNDFSKDFLVRSCGKLWVLDRILIKLQRTGHRVLLFSTMTRLLDILEEYLQWRRLVYRRIDGTTSLEDRESAIMDFNSPGTDCFIFLLSIRAAGRGLNLQSADTVVIYDPDPNPKNEEQAVARAHRIGQTREVKVIYMEAVVDKISSHQKEDEYKSGGVVDSEDYLAGKDRYIGSIESLIRKNIQQYKIDMADEVINAGRFDQRTTHEERRLTLETMLHDEERYQETVHDVPSMQEVNRMIARSEQEVELFDQMDDELDWMEEMVRYDQVPEWLRASTREANATIACLSKKPYKTTLLGGSGRESIELASDVTEKKRGRPKGKKFPNYRDLDDEVEESSEASSEEINEDSLQEEEGEIVEFEEEEFSGAIGAPPVNKDQSEEDGPVCAGGYEYPQASGSTRHNRDVEVPGSSGSSSDNRRLTQMVSPSMSSQRFGSLSALDARPSSLSKRKPDELEEGEIAGSGDSYVDPQQSGSWIQDRDEGEEEQVLQSKLKRKRSIRVRPRHNAERSLEKHPSENPFLHPGDLSHLPFQLDQKHEVQLRNESEPSMPSEPNAFKHNQRDSSLKSRQNLPSQRTANTSKVHASLKSYRSNSLSAPSEDVDELSRESWDGMGIIGTSIGGNKMSDAIQRRCKSVLSKLRRRIDKEGPQIVPLLTDLWKRIESSSYLGGAANSLTDFRKIDQRVERYEYNGVMDLVFDVQFMLKSGMHYFGFSHEVRSEARKVHDLFFDILKIAFPDTDFQEARYALSFSGPVATSTSAPPLRQEVASQSKRHKLVKEAEPDPIPPRKMQTHGHLSSAEDARSETHMPPKESRIGGSSSREQGPQDNIRALTHPGELVVCKKKRKDREKSVVKPGNGAAGPVSPPSGGRITRSSGAGSISKDTRLSQLSTYQQGRPQQPPQQVNGGGGVVSWANPVKRSRTDAGKRRPSNL